MPAVGAHPLPQGPYEDGLGYDYFGGIFLTTSKLMCTRKTAEAKLKDNFQHLTNSTY